MQVGSESMRRDGFRNTNVGVPYSSYAWDVVVRLGDTRRLFPVNGTPSTKIPDYWGGDIAWLTPSDVNLALRPIYRIVRSRSYQQSEGLEIIQGSAKW